MTNDPDAQVVAAEAEPGDAFRKKRRKPLPGVNDVTENYVPIYIPTSEGGIAMEVGAGRLEDGKLTIEFDNSVASVAIQRMISRKILLGLQFVAHQSHEEPADPAEDATDESQTKGEN